MEDRPASEDYYQPPQVDSDDAMPDQTWLDIYYSYLNRYAELCAAYARALGLL